MSGTWSVGGMSSSPEQSNSNVQHTIGLSLSRGLSDASMVSRASLGSGGESPPNHSYHGNTLTPPQLLNVLGAPSSSTPNSPHLGSRPSSGNLVKGNWTWCWIRLGGVGLDLVVLNGSNGVALYLLMMTTHWV